MNRQGRGINVWTEGVAFGAAAPGDRLRAAEKWEAEWIFSNKILISCAQQIE